MPQHCPLLAPIACTALPDVLTAPTLCPRRLTRFLAFPRSVASSRVRCHTPSHLDAVRVHSSTPARSTAVPSLWACAHDDPPWTYLCSLLATVSVPSSPSRCPPHLLRALPVLCPTLDLPPPLLVAARERTLGSPCPLRLHTHVPSAGSSSAAVIAGVPVPARTAHHRSPQPALSASPEWPVSPSRPSCTPYAGGEASGRRRASSTHRLRSTTRAGRGHAGSPLPWPPTLSALLALGVKRAQRAPRALPFPPFPPAAAFSTLFGLDIRRLQTRTGNPHDFRATFHDIETRYQLSWECAELIIGLGSGPPAPPVSAPPLTPPPGPLSAPAFSAEGQPSREQAVILSSDEPKPGPGSPAPAGTSNPAQWRATTGRHDLSSHQLILLREMLNSSDSATPAAQPQLPIPEEDLRATKVNRSWRWGDATGNTVMLPSDGDGSPASGPHSPSANQKRQKRRSSRLRGIRDMLQSLKKMYVDSGNSHGLLVPVAPSTISVSASADSSVGASPQDVKAWPTWRRRAKTSTGPESSSSVQEQDGHPDALFTASMSLQHKTSPRRPSLASIFRLTQRSKSGSSTIEQQLDKFGFAMPSESVYGSAIPNEPAIADDSDTNLADWDRVDSASDIERDAWWMAMTPDGFATVRGREKSPYPSQQQAGGEHMTGASRSSLWSEDQSAQRRTSPRIPNLQLGKPASAGGAQPLSSRLLVSNVNVVTVDPSNPPRTLPIITQDLPQETPEFKLAMTPENIRPLLENAREVLARCDECIVELRSLLATATGRAAHLRLGNGKAPAPPRGCGWLRTTAWAPTTTKSPPEPEPEWIQEQRLANDAAIEVTRNTGNDQSVTPLVPTPEFLAARTAALAKIEWFKNATANIKALVPDAATIQKDCFGAASRVGAQNESTPDASAVAIHNDAAPTSLPDPSQPLPDAVPIVSGCEVSSPPERSPPNSPPSPEMPLYSTMAFIQIVNQVTESVEEPDVNNPYDWEGGRTPDVDDIDSLRPLKRTWQQMKDLEVGAKQSQPRLTEQRIIEATILKGAKRSRPNPNTKFLNPAANSGQKSRWSTRCRLDDSDNGEDAYNKGSQLKKRRIASMPNGHSDSSPSPEVADVNMDDAPSAPVTKPMEVVEPPSRPSTPTSPPVSTPTPAPIPCPAVTPLLPSPVINSSSSSHVGRLFTCNSYVPHEPSKLRTSFTIDQDSEEETDSRQEHDSMMAHTPVPQLVELIPSQEYPPLAHALAPSTSMVPVSAEEHPANAHAPTKAHLVCQEHPLTPVHAPATLACNAVTSCTSTSGQQREQETVMNSKALEHVASVPLEVLPRYKFSAHVAPSPSAGAHLTKAWQFTSSVPVHMLPAYDFVKRVASSLSTSAVSLSKQPEWICGLCQLRSPDSAVKCIICEAPWLNSLSLTSPSPASSSLSSAPSAPPPTPSAPSPSLPVSGFNWAAAGLAPLSATSEWECSICMVRNKSSVQQCIACESPKP
ncbi:hypothetical protein WOLCODRAFT_167411 [Wolfiporia cocos MD-104 SS10]|uniref:RanBP2-type domain-containing protein n=1 Tax=Wolfiporia cocos (strain MD-104) TaxID=742152 RepID=A0A2H3JBV1_WOLCO|nr:hypothetical protein WOLCODRAFT_167411 [Wolfiporia cocos MD-104 SS10]